MIKNINLGNKESSLKILYHLKQNKYHSLDIRLINTHIKDLNNILGKNVFKNDVVYANAIMFWEIMQPLGGKGKHHYHNLTPENVFEALSTMHHSENVTLSYDDRYVIVTLAKIAGGINIAAVVTPKGSSVQKLNRNVIRIITMYPCSK